MSGFKKAVSVVTGAAAGIGRQFAIELARRRGRVVLADVDREGLDETAELVRRAQGRAHVVPCDVRSWEQIQALADATVDWAGVPDLVVLNAGVLTAGPLVRTAPADLYAIDARHGRLAWRIKGIAPALTARLAAFASATINN